MLCLSRPINRVIYNPLVLHLGNTVLPFGAIQYILWVMLKSVTHAVIWYGEALLPGAA